MPNYDFFTDGFKLSGAAHGIKDIAAISLKIAINAYFSTYRAIIYNFNQIENPGNYRQTEEQLDRTYFNPYYEAYAETITHFHHFIELTLKRVLQSKHELLLGEINDPVMLYKILNNQISQEDIEKSNLKAVSYKDTLNRICDLIKEDIISKSDFQFILDSKTWLNELGVLRNKLLHRGMFILRYKALDELVGKFILPFTMKIADAFKDEIPERYWKYKKIDCGIDPIPEIINVFQNGSYDMGKVAFLKELGRAAYSNDIPDGFIEKFHRKEYINVYEKAALDFKLGVSEISKCPVCGINTLTIYEESDGDQEEDGSYSSWWTYIWQVRCIHCGFEIHHEIKNPSVYGYKIEDWFWENVHSAE